MCTPLAVPRSPLPRICTYTNLLTILQTLRECLCARASVELTHTWTCPRGTFRSLEHLDMRQTISQTHKNIAKLGRCYVQLSTVHHLRALSAPAHPPYRHPLCQSPTRSPSPPTRFSSPTLNPSIVHLSSIYLSSVCPLSLIFLASFSWP